MSFQKKLYPCFDREFWGELARPASFLVRDLIMGRDVARLAQSLREAGIKCSDSLLYKWANPNDEALPSLRAFLVLVKLCENCGPIESINEACGVIGVPEGDYREGIKLFTAEFEKRERQGRRVAISDQ